MISCDRIDEAINHGTLKGFTQCAEELKSDYVSDKAIDENSPCRSMSVLDFASSRSEILTMGGIVEVPPRGPESVPSKRHWTKFLMCS